MAAMIGDRLQKVADRSTLQVTHIGSKSGKAHQVTICFQGDKILLLTSNIDRNWVRTVRKTPHVELTTGADKFSGEAHFLENAANKSNDPAQVPDKWSNPHSLGTAREVRPRHLQVRRIRSIVVRVNVNDARLLWPEGNR